MPRSCQNVREYLVVYGCVRVLMTAIVAVTVAVRDTSRPSAFRSGESDQGCRRRPKTKYDSGPTGAELTNTAAVIYIRFEPRTWLAGRRVMSMITGVLRTASPIAEATISLRLRWLRLLHRVAMTSSASRRGPANDYDRPDVFQLHVDTRPRSAFVERNLATDLSTF